MASLTQVELSSIRELVSGHQTSASKMRDYAEKCQDQQIKQMFSQSATEAGQSAQKLLQYL